MTEITNLTPDWGNVHPSHVLSSGDGIGGTQDELIVMPSDFEASVIVCYTLDQDGYHKVISSPGTSLANYRAITQYGPHMYIVDTDRAKVFYDKWTEINAFAEELFDVTSLFDVNDAIKSLGSDSAGIFIATKNTFDDEMYIRWANHNSGTFSGSIGPIIHPPITNIFQIWRVRRNPQRFLVVDGDDAFYVDEDGTETTLGIHGASDDGVFTRAMAYGGNVLYVAPADGDVPQRHSFMVIGATDVVPDVTLDTIVGDLCSQAGLLAAEYDVTDLATETVGGYMRPRQMSARAAIEPLTLVRAFDASESDGKIKFIRRGTLASAATINQADLGVHEYGVGGPVEHDIIRRNEKELPAKIEVHYIDRNKGYQQGVEYASRTVTGSEHVLTVEIPAAMSSTKARRIASTLLNLTFRTQQMPYTITIGPEFADLEPSDVITVEFPDGSLQEGRIAGQLWVPPGMATLQLEPEDSSAFDHTDDGSDDDPVDDNVDPPPGPTQAFILDIPPILQNDRDDAGVYVTGSGFTTTWRGAVVYHSRGGQAYDLVSPMIGACCSGFATGVIGFADHCTWDYDSTVNVALTNSADTLSSSTEAEVLEGANGAVLGDEIIQYVTATLEGDGTYTLSTLLRGRLGTEYARYTHQNGERFVSLNTDQRLVNVPLQIDQVGLLQYFRVPSIGQLFSEARTQVHLSQGNRIKPWSPVHLEATRDGSNNITLTWVRRDKHLASPLWDPVNSEETEEYEIELRDPASPSTLYRTETILGTPTFSWPAATQTSDGHTAGATVRVNVYQMSAAIGRGHQLQGDV